MAGPLVNEPPADDNPTTPPDISREALVGLWLESLVVLIVGVLPFWASACFSILWSNTYQSNLVEDCLNRMVWSLQAMAPAVYFMVWSKNLSADGGLTRPRWLDPLAGLAICLTGLITYLFLEAALPGLIWELRKLDLEQPPSYPQPIGWRQHLLVGVWLILNGVSEETVVRGCLLPRFEKMFGSAVSAVVLTSFFFAVYHAYQGPIGVFHALVFGLIYGGFYCWWRRIWPLALAHGFAGLAVQYWP